MIDWLTLGNGRVRLACGDCREILPTIEKPALIIADPPYLVHAGYGGGCFGGRNHLVNTGGFTDGGCDYSFLDKQTNWFCFCSRRQLLDLLGIAEQAPHWNLITWGKPNPVPACNNKYLPDVEYIIHAFENGRLFGTMREKSCFIIYPCGNKITDHPNEKPVPVLQKLVLLGTKLGERILDPYMGVGSSGIAAIRAGRDFTGIEIDPHWFSVAVDRIQRELDQPSLFEPPPPPPEQGTLW